MPDQSSAADEHALLQDITAPMSRLPADRSPLPPDPDFTIVLRGYDRDAVDEYVRHASQLVDELQATHSSEAAVRRALEQVGEQTSGILQRAHETASQITVQSRAEAEARLELARREAQELTAGARREAEELTTGAKREAQELTAAGRRRARELDADVDRIWAERRRIVDDARGLAQELLSLAESAADRFPSASTEESAALGMEDTEEGAPALAPTSHDSALATPEPFDAEATVVFEAQEDRAADDIPPTQA